MDDQQTGSSESDAVEYQLGHHDTETDGVDLGDGSEFLPWDLEVQAAMKRLAIDIYSSDESGVAEPLTNSTAAILKAVEEDHLDAPTDGEVRFTVAESNIDEPLLNDPDYDGPAVERELTIRDNGIGMTDATVRKVLRFLGRSMTRDAGNRSGQFGMGFVAIFMLTGWSAALELHTHSRQEGESPISAVINNRGITIDHDGVLDGRMGENEYGTKIKLLLKDDVTNDDMRKWLVKNGEFARTPVVYEELGETGSQTYSREHPISRLEDNYEAGDPTVVYEDEFIRAVTSPSSDGRSLLLDVPIRRGYNRGTNLPWSFDIRLKNENRPIVKSSDSDRKGLYVTERGEYESMNAERQAKYTHEVRDDEVAMASVAGTRDTLKKDKEFWTEYVLPNLQGEYKSWVNEGLRVVSDLSDLQALSPSDLSRLRPPVVGLIDKWADYRYDRERDDYTPEQLIEDMNEEYGFDIDERAARLLVLLDTTATVVSHKHDIDNQPSWDNGYPDGRGEQKLWSVMEDAPGRVFMGVSLNQKKVDVVHEDSDENRVVELDSAGGYDLLTDGLGWERLAGITRTSIDEFDISNSLQSKFKNNVGATEPTNVENTEVTVTWQTLKMATYSREWKIQREANAAHEIHEAFQNHARHSGRRPRYGSYSSTCNARALVLFPDSSDKNVSDYYWLGSGDLAIAKASDAVVSYLTTAENIMTFAQYRQKAENYSVTNSNGTSPSTGTNPIPDDVDEVVFHLLSEDKFEYFSAPDILYDMPETLQDRYGSNSSGTNAINGRAGTYAPITRDDLVYIRYYLQNDSDAVLLCGNESYECPQSKTTNDEARLYARTTLRDIDGVPPEVEQFFDNMPELNEGSVSVLYTIASHYVQQN
jgi:hypothetical protein